VFPYSQNSQHPAIHPFSQWPSVHPWEFNILHQHQHQHPFFVPGLKNQQQELLQETSSFPTEPISVNQDAEVVSSCFSDFDCTGNAISSNINPRSCLTKGGSSWKFFSLGHCVNVRPKLNLSESARPVYVLNDNSNSSGDLGNFDEDYDD